MPSYRVTLVVGALAPTTGPEQVLPRAAALAAERTVVEAQDVQLVRGEPRAVVRYEAEDDGVATGIADHVTAGMRPDVEIRSADVTRRDGGRWVRVS
ncbi:hypothetical protein [Curtobacterium sp. Leaf261]|uniref:hypothetical protein n=1 Tax=Curtobacterium sp. Leaf261 TaxID=1736311 RepID=UPI0006F88E7E|nr:hypothetical protein [Curtobacterium sp. Leaf261]KQO62490.1 hypothetical protein ASF23_11470 [Curtobacterium sp. Leaf261]